jgi:hypothetical protein
VRVALARATLAQARGQPLHETAAELIEQPVRGHLDRLGLWPAQVLLIETLLDAGEHTAARNTLGRLEGLVAQRGTTLATTDLARLRGRLAEADGDLEGARASYAAATTSGRVLPLPAARLALAHATLLRQLDQPRAAIARLRDARTGFAALAARPFIVRCDEELIACGLPAATGGLADPFELSADEYAVATW